MKRVLSISGGGMRGVIPGRILMEIEQRVGFTAAGCFDLMAGSSTGGILACLAASPGGISARGAMDFYYESGPRIFANTMWRSLYAGGGAIHTKYPGDVLARELRACIGDYKLHEAQTHLMVTTLESHRRAEMVKSWSPEWADLPMATAALMTASAQTYFPQATIDHPGRNGRYLDGGNVRNAPMACAAFEAGALWGFAEPITLVHLGTGRVRNPKPLPNGGALFWAAEIFDCTTNGDDSYDDYFCRGLEKFIPDFRYYRLDVDLDKFPAMDDASPHTLDALVAQTEQMLAAEDRLIDEICEMLTEEKMAI